MRTDAWAFENKNNGFIKRKPGVHNAQRRHLISILGLTTPYNYAWVAPINHRGTPSVVIFLMGRKLRYHRILPELVVMLSFKGKAEKFKWLRRVCSTCYHTNLDKILRKPLNLPCGLERVSCSLGRSCDRIFSRTDAITSSLLACQPSLWIALDNGIILKIARPAVVVG